MSYFSMSKEEMESLFKWTAPVKKKWWLPNTRNSPIRTALPLGHCSIARLYSEYILLSSGCAEKPAWPRDLLRAVTFVVFKLSLTIRVLLDTEPCSLPCSPLNAARFKRLFI